MNLAVVQRYVDRFSSEIESQPTVNNELDACKDVYDYWLAPLKVNSVVELGGGASPMLSLFPNDIEKLSISLGGEPNTVTGDMNTPDLPDDYADLVIARHALEHSLMPLIMLCEMYRITKKYALVVVPSCSEEMANYSNHYSVFTPVALRALFKRAGFTLVFEELNAPLYGDITEDRYFLTI